MEPFDPLSFSRSIKRLIELLTLVDRPNQMEESHRSIALRLIEMEMSLLNRRWQQLRILLERP